MPHMLVEPLAFVLGVLGPKLGVIFGGASRRSLTPPSSGAGAWTRDASLQTSAPLIPQKRQRQGATRAGCIGRAAANRHPMREASSGYPRGPTGSN